MGVAKEKRPILAPEGIQAGETTSPSTFASAVNISGALTLSSGLTLGKSTYGVTAALQTLGNKSVDFITVASSGSGRDFQLGAPPAVGFVKFIFIDNQTTSIDTRILTGATARTFWGTTFNQAALSAASTGSPGGTDAGTVALGLVGATSVQWAVFPGSTFNWDFAASTGSTATA